MVQDISRMADIFYVRQKEALGLGHAIYSAHKFIGDEPFAVLRTWLSNECEKYKLWEDASNYLRHPLENS